MVSSVMERKEDKEYILEAYLGVMKSIMNLIKKIPSLVSLIVSIMFNDLSRMRNLICWTY